MAYQSRGPEINTEKCVEMVGGNKFNLILIAAQRAREIRKSDSPTQSLPVVTALLEVQEGKIDPKKYLRKIK